MGFNYENAASRQRQGRPVSTEAPDRLRLRIEMKHQRQLFRARSPDVGSDVSMKIGYVHIFDDVFRTLYKERH
jgi:hypothetical protein